MPVAVSAFAVATLSAFAVVAPSAHARLDADEACDGGLYDIEVYDGQRYAECLTGYPIQAPWGTLTAPDVRASEGEHAVTFTVSRGTSVNTIWFTYTTVDGTAKAGVDYTATSGSVRWVDELSKTITVPIADDAVRTGDRSFGLRLLPGAGGPTVTLPARDAVATIGEDDPEPTPPVGETTQDPPAATTATTVAPAPTPVPVPVPTATVPSAAPAPPTTPAAPAARLAQARTLTSVLAGRTNLAVRCAGHCALSADLTLTTPTARALGLKTRTIGAARGTGSGRILLPIRLSTPAKAALRRHPRTVVATATIHDTAGAPPRTVRITLRRPR